MTYGDGTLTRAIFPVSNYPAAEVCPLKPEVVVINKRF